MTWYDMTWHKHRTQKSSQAKHEWIEDDDDEDCDGDGDGDE